MGSTLRGLSALADEASSKASLAKEYVTEAVSLIRDTPTDATDKQTKERISEALDQLDDAWWVLSELEDR